jgi:hypothetical protein
MRDRTPHTNKRDRIPSSASLHSCCNLLFGKWMPAAEFEVIFDSDGVT